MSYKLKFLPQAEKEWYKLDNSIKVQLKKKLTEVVENPHISKNRLHGFHDCYKIKLRDSGWRLVYQVEEKVITVFVISIGKRDKSEAYEKAKLRT